MDSPIKWHGGKHYLAPKLWELAKSVPHVHRVEVYGGGLAFTLASEPEGYSEVVNDVYESLTNFWIVLRSPELFSRFVRQVEATPFSESLWGQSRVDLNRYETGYTQDLVCWAVAFFVCCRQSLAGRMDHFAPLSKSRTRRGMNEQASAWLTALEGLSSVHERMKRVAVRCKDGVAVVKAEDSPGTLFYCDPPYMEETRSSGKQYRHEMSYDEHSVLLATLTKIAGKFILSGYPSDLYDHYAKTYGWRVHDYDLPNNAAAGTSKRRMTERVWTNF